jgi:hypothetical protein
MLYLNGGVEPSQSGDSDSDAQSLVMWGLAMTHYQAIAKKPPDSKPLIPVRSYLWKDGVGKCCATWRLGLIIEKGPTPYLLHDSCFIFVFILGKR